MKIFEIKEGVVKQIIIFRNVMIRLNVYVALYYKNVIIKYVIFNNCIILSDKDKHK